MRRINSAVRAALPCALLLAFGAGCAHANRSTGMGEERVDSSRRDTLTSEEIRRSPEESVEKALMGRFAGVQVMENADGSLAVRIRGQSSIRGGNDPLYVINGIPIEPGPGGALFGVTPNDVESIRVLKNPAETASYGVRGANGVILITTK